VHRRTQQTEILEQPSVVVMQKQIKRWRRCDRLEARV
jgi:hypothetical protein